MTDILERVRKIVRETDCGVYLSADSTIADDQPLFYEASNERQEDAIARGNAGLDSLDRVEIVMAIDEDFDVEVSDHVASSWNSITDIAAWLTNQGEA